jgi:WD40 repeat protein
LDKTVKIWQISTGKCIATLEGHSTGIKAVAFSPNGETLASGGHGLRGPIKLWDVSKGKSTASLEGGESSVLALAFSPDGKTLASGHALTIKLWDVTTGDQRSSLEGHEAQINSVAFSPDGKLLASGSATNFGLKEKGRPVIKLWDLSTDKNVTSLEGHTSWVMCVAFSPSGKVLASGSADDTVHGGEGVATIKLWDVSSGKNTATLTGHDARINSIAFSPDGKTLASASNDKTIKLWDIATGKNTVTLKRHTGSVKSLAFSPDGKILASAGDDKTIRLWNVTNLAEEK